MITPKDQVAMMFGIGVAEQLDEAGLLVREHHEPAFAKAGVVMGVPSHWMVRCEWNGVTDLTDRNYANTMYPPNSLDSDIKAWLYELRAVGDRGVESGRRYEKIYNKDTSAARWAKMLSNFGKPWGITGTLVPVKFVEVG